MKNNLKTYLFLTSLFISFAVLFSFNKTEIFTSEKVIGQPIDSLNGVLVFYNGKVSNVVGRNTTEDGYNIGLKYQCVEFVKKYYYQHLNHKMPNSYGHAKDFFNQQLPDGRKNIDRNLIQYTNPSHRKPKVNDLIVFDGNVYNPYGHVAIISKLSDNEIEIIQQNPGPSANSRASLKIQKIDDKWKIKSSQVLGWLGK
jgi:surface antigen